MCQAYNCLIAVGPASVAHAATLFSQTVTLSPGWNIVSTPRVLDSHAFSAEENATNFDIYVLDASQTSGWATMAQLGQTEFAPLWGYFIDNKTGVAQTLTLNYKADTQPNERLFERSFSTPGWYSIGVANATYAIPQHAATSTDSNNPSALLSAPAGNYDNVVDLTSGLSVSDIRSTAVAATWEARTSSDINMLNDWRETKAYAIHVSQSGALYDGFQNAEARSFSLTYTAGTNGSVTGTTTQTVPEGGTGDAVTAVPDAGYSFDGWSDGSMNNPRTETDVASDVNVTANFIVTPAPAALTVSASSNPASQNIVAGSQNVTFANYLLDATLSGEDVQLSSFPIWESGTGATNMLNTCQLWDSSTALNTGSDVVNLVSEATTTVVFTNGALHITKGTIKTLTLKCNLSSGAVSGDTYTFGVHGLPTVTGVTSGNSFEPALVSGDSGTMTIAASATVSASIDPTSPSYAVNAAGTTGVTMGVVKLRATNENFNLTKLGLKLNSSLGKTGSGAAATAPGDLVTVYLYNSTGTLLGTATFTGSNTTATSTLSSPLTLTHDTDTTVIIKADLASIGSANSGGVGDLLKVDPLNYEGTGVSSGNTVKGAATSGVAGNRMFKSYPTLALDTLGSTGVADGRLMHFKVTASSAGSVGIDKFTFAVSTTSTTVTNVNLYGYTDSSYSSAISGQGSGGIIGSQLNSIPSSAVFSISPTTNPVQVPAGTTYYFELRGSVAGVQTGSAVVTTLKGDAAYDAVASGYQVNTVAGLTSSNFIWSGNSITTAASLDIDWSNGYSLPGLPAAGIIQTRSN